MRAHTCFVVFTCAIFAADHYGIIVYALFPPPHHQTFGPHLQGLVFSTNLDRTRERLAMQLLLSHATASRRTVGNFRSNLANMHVLHSAMSTVLVDQIISDMPWLDDAIEEEEPESTL